MHTQSITRFATIRLNTRDAWQPIAVTSYSAEGGEGKLLAEFPYKAPISSTSWIPSLPLPSPPTSWGRSYRTPGKFSVSA